MLTVREVYRVASDYFSNNLLLFVLQINLRLILVSGKTKEFLFSPNDSAADIAKHVYDNWPMGVCRLTFYNTHEDGCEV